MSKAWDNQGAVVDDRNTLAMDHQHIEDQRIADRYLDRTLAHAERLAFEKHFVDCAECLDRLALAEMFRDTPPRYRETKPAGPVGDPAPVPVIETPSAAAAKAIAKPAEESTRVESVAAPASKSKAGGFRQANTQTLEMVAIFATAAVLFVSIPAAYFLWQYANERRADQGPSAAIYVLHRDREVEVSIAATPHPLVFLLDVDRETGAEQRVSLTAGGKVVWNGGSIVEVRAIPAVLVPSRVLPRGACQLRVESKASGGDWRVVGEFPLLVSRAN